MKLYKIRVTNTEFRDVIVAANSERQAVSWVKNKAAEDENFYRDYDWAVETSYGVKRSQEILTRRQVPSAYELTDFPYGLGSEGITIGEMLGIYKEGVPKLLLRAVEPFDGNHPGDLVSAPLDLAKQLIEKGLAVIN